MFEELVEDLVRQAQRVSCEQARLLTCIRAVAKATPVVEFAADEVAFALTWTRKAAEAQVALAIQLLDHMPEVFAALGTGVIDLPKARVFAEVLQPLDPAVAREVAAQVLPVAGEKTTAQIRARLHRRALAADPSSAAKRRERALADRRVVLESSPDGTAVLTALGLPAQRAMAAFERVNAIAKARKLAGEELSIDQLRADTLLDLLEGVGVGAIPGVRRGAIELTVGLDTLAGLNERPALLGGYGPVGADVARQCAFAGLDSQWRFNVVHPATGELLFQGITRTRPDQPVQDRGPEPRPPMQDPADRFANAAMTRWIRSRDKTCRAPGCRVAASACDIDHTVDFGHGGPTTHDQLGLLCRHHHRLKHEGQWEMRQIEPGVFTWLSPAGRIYRVGPEPP